MPSTLPHLKLTFSNAEPELEKVEFRKAGAMTPEIRRHRNGDFRWDWTVRAFAVLILHLRAWRGRPADFFLEGEKGKSAVSTFLNNYDKDTLSLNRGSKRGSHLFGCCLTQVFGGNRKGNPPFRVSVIEGKLQPEWVEIEWADSGRPRLIDDPSSLLRMAAAVEGQVKAWEKCSSSASPQTRSLPKQSRIRESGSLEFRSATPVEVHQALKEKGMYRESAEYSLGQIDLAHRRRDNLESAKWGAIYSSDQRALGDLDKSIHAAKKAKSHLNHFLRDNGETSETKLLSLKIQFGYIVAKRAMQEADFPKGFREHSSLNQVARSLAREAKNTEIGRAAREYALHTARQQAECLRYLGKYGRALRLGKKVENLYPPGDVVPRFWCRIYQADNLRLLGAAKEASELFTSLASEARGGKRILAHLSILWRQIVSESCDSDRMSKDRIQEMQEALKREPPNVLAKVYGHLCLAAVKHFDPVAAKDHLDSAFKTGVVGPRKNRIEYAYGLMIRAEVSRGCGDTTSARRDFDWSLTIFREVGVIWGQVRATVGMSICGVQQFRRKKWSHLEGKDEVVWNRYLERETIPAGCLCANFP